MQFSKFCDIEIVNAGAFKFRVVLTMISQMVLIAREHDWAACMDRFGVYLRIICIHYIHAPYELSKHKYSYVKWH